jgi:hypothetical protein
MTGNGERPPKDPLNFIGADIKRLLEMVTSSHRTDRERLVEAAFHLRRNTIKEIRRVKNAGRVPDPDRVARWDQSLDAVMDATRDHVHLSRNRDILRMLVALSAFTDNKSLHAEATVRLVEVEIDFLATPHAKNVDIDEIDQRLSTIDRDALSDATKLRIGQIEVELSYAVRDWHSRFDGLHRS